jgi:hypothetical protein
MLTILTITKGERHAWYFLRAMQEAARHLHASFVVCADGEVAFALCCKQLEGATVARVDSRGYLEDVLEEGVMCCPPGYILRLDDDERINARMMAWLEARKYESSDHWKFPRVHIWEETGAPDILGLTNPPLWPDHQTRLSVKEKSGGRFGVHAGSPYGGGTVAPVCFEHYKFAVKSFDERKAIASRYDRYAAGYGSGGMLAFNLPEEALGTLELKPLSWFEEQAAAA